MLFRYTPGQDQQADVLQMDMYDKVFPITKHTGPIDPESGVPQFFPIVRLKLCDLNQLLENISVNGFLNPQPSHCRAFDSLGQILPVFESPDLIRKAIIENEEKIGGTPHPDAVDIRQIKQLE